MGILCIITREQGTDDSLTVRFSTLGETPDHVVYGRSELCLGNCRRLFFCGGRLQTRGCRAGRNKHKVRAQTAFRVTPSAGGVSPAGAVASPPTANPCLQSLVRSPSSLNQATHPASKLAQSSSGVSWTRSPSFGAPPPPHGPHVGPTGGAAVPPPPPLHYTQTAGDRTRLCRVIQGSSLVCEYAQRGDARKGLNQGPLKREAEDHGAGRTAALDGTREDSMILAEGAGQPRSTKENPGNGGRQNTGRSREGGEQLSTPRQRSQPAAFLVSDGRTRLWLSNCPGPSQPGGAAG